MAQHFSLAACDVVGFDLDHTLCRYNLPESARLIYNSFAQFLVKEKGYDKELLTLTPEDWDFCCKGLALDLEDGTFIKLAADGTVLRASRGTRMMTPEALAEAYSKRNWRHCTTGKHSAANVDLPCCSGKCYFYDNYFDLPGALLCAKVVDSLTKNRGQKTFDFWKDVVAGIQHNFKMSAFKENCGFFFPEIKRNLGKYVHRCPESVRRWLRELKAAGKITMLITSSHSDYCKLLGTYILGKDFADLFDIVITNALKPGFFSHCPSQRPFHTLKNDEEQEELPSLDKPGWYSQGNAAHLYELLKKMTDKPEPKVVYFGDSMHSDIFPAHHYSNWETVLILEELQGQEMEKAEDAEPLEKRGKYEEPKIKPLNSLSNKWGSYFTDSVSRRGDAEDSLVYTWSSRRISTSSTIAIPSIEVIAELPLDYKFTRFSTNNSKTAGYYPLVHYALGSQDTSSKTIFTEK